MPATRRIIADETTIREHAYHLWERDGRPHGRDVEFWDRAASELAVLTRRKAPAKAAAPKAAEPVPAAKTPAKSGAVKAAPAAKPRAKAKAAG